MHDLFSTLSHLGTLGAEAFNKILQPAGHVHAVFTDALDGPVEGRTVPVLEFTDREQPLEVVSGLMEAKGEEKAERPGVVVVGCQGAGVFGGGNTLRVLYICVTKTIAFCQTTKSL